MSIDKRQYLLAVSLLLIASFIINLGFSALSPVFPYLILALKGVLKELPELAKGMIQAHKGAVELGMLTAAFMVTRAPTAGIVGFLSDVLGKKRTILLGMGVYFVSSLGFVLSNDLLLFIVFRGLQGIASAMVWLVAEAYLVDITPRWSRGKAISIYTSSMLVAEILGPSIGVGVYKLYVTFFGGSNIVLALKSPIVFLALSCFFSMVTLYFLPTSKKTETIHQDEKIGFRTVLRKLKEMSNDIARSIKVIYINGLINGVAMGILNTVAIIYIIERVAKDPVLIGMFFSVFSFSALPATLLAGYLSDRTKKRKPFIIMGYVLGRTVFFFIPLVSDYLLLLILGTLLSMVFGFSTPNMRALQADLAPEGIRGSIFGLQQLFFNSCIFAGALIGGYLAKTYAAQFFNILGYMFSGYIVPFWIAGILGAITTILFILYVKET